MAKFNMSEKKTPMQMQDKDVRICNFNEVALGYTQEEAVNEAKRCLNCKNKPCIAGCPVAIKIPEFISKIAEEKFEEAYEIISEDSSLPAVCGRVCPQESQCEKYCTRKLKKGCESVGIGRLERFVADYHNSLKKEIALKTENNGIKVAVIGSGPAGLSCAGELAKRGYKVTVFEALHELGGVLIYGIPEFRLPKKIVATEVENLKNLGVDFETNVVVGKTLTVSELKEEYGFSAVFIGSGAGLPKFMGIEGENLKGVYSANEFLTRSNLMKAYLDNSTTPIQRPQITVVVGGGNVAMDAARTARRLGSEVHIVYRRSMEELPARKEEVEHAEEEGIIFDLLTNPVKIVSSNEENVRSENYKKAVGIECIKMQLGEPDVSGRRSPVEIKNSNFFMKADCIIMALGTSPNPLIKNTTEGLETLKRGEIATDENGKTSLDGVYCGGDASTGSATVIKAMGAGKLAAKSIDEYLKK